MVLPAHVLQQKEVEGRIERTKDEEADEEKVKEAAEKGLTSDELQQQAAVVMATSTDTGKILSGPFLHKRCVHDHFLELQMGLMLL